MSLEESVAYDKVVGMRQAAFGVQEYKVQFVLTYRFVVSLHDVDGFRLPIPIQCIDLAQRVPRGSEQANLARRTPGFRNPISPAHFGPAERHGALLKVDIFPSQGDGLRNSGATRMLAILTVLGVVAQMVGPALLRVLFP